MVSNDPNIAWETWKNIFLGVCNKHAPFKTRRIKSYLPPWITPEYKELAHKRDYLKRKAQLSNNEHDWKCAKETRNKVNLLNRSLKRKYFHDVIKENANNTRKLWKTLREHGGLGSKNGTLNGSDDCKDNVVYANQMNDHFCRVGHSVYQTEANCDMSNYNCKQTSSVSDEKNANGANGNHGNNFMFKRVTNEYVFKQLRSLSTKKATGVDDLPAKLLKLAAPYISKVLSNICNMSLDKGIVPNEWKEARVTPIHKGGDKDDLNNFRPISVLPVISKILERFVHDELYYYLQCHNIMVSEQSGFRPHHST